MNDAKVLGVIGLGSMGYSAAVSAMKRGVSTIELDSARGARTLAAAGGQLAASLADLAARCDVVQVLVVNAVQTGASAVRRTRAGRHAAPPARGRSASATVDPRCRRSGKQRLAERGIHLIDGPGVGRRQRPPTAR